MLLLLRCLFEVQFFGERYALFLVGAGISCSFILGGVGKSRTPFFCWECQECPVLLGIFKFGDPSRPFGLNFPSKKRSPLPSLMTAKLLLPWS